MLFRFVAGRLGLVARAVYILWATAVLGWMHHEGIEVLRGFVVYIAGLAVFYPLMWLIAAGLEHKIYEKWFRHGGGGSARWGGVLAFRKYGWRRIQRNPKAPIFLGKTLHKYDPWPFCRKIGIDDINHLITIAQSGSGKSTTVIWPNLVKYAYPDSVFILDPKGEHAVLTSRHRAARGQHVYVLDPFNVTKGQIERHCFNPLAEIDPDSPRAKGDIKQIAEACVMTEATSISEGGEHFRGLATKVITGLIAHVLTKLPKEQRTLPEVYKHFQALRRKEDFESFLPEMEQNPACGNAPSEAVAAYLGSPDKNRGDIFTTVLNALEWVSDDGMREHLSRSDFSLEELRTHRTTIYVVLDFKTMKPQRQGRFMRMLINLAFEKCYNVPLPQDRKEAGRRTLFILDEVAQLGPMPSIAEGYQSLRGYDTKIWTFFQNYGAMVNNSYKSPDDLLGNASKQFFGCNSPKTAEMIKSYLGYKRDSKTGEKKALLDTDQIMNTLGQDDPDQIVITGESVKYKMELKRETFIPPEWKPEWEFENSRLYPLFLRLKELADRIQKITAYRVVVSVVIVASVTVLWLSDVFAGEPWYGQWIGKGIGTWTLIAIWIFFTGFGKVDPEFQGISGPGEMTEEREKKAREIMDAARRENLKFRERSRRIGELRAEPELWAAWIGFSDEEKEEWLVRKTRPEFEAFVDELRRQAEEVPQEEPEKKPEPEADSEEAGEGIRSEEQQEHERQAESRYTPEQDAARRRWVLPVGFADPQVDERLPIMLENAGADEVDKVMEEYKLLKACAA